MTDGYIGNETDVLRGRREESRPYAPTLGPSNCGLTEVCKCSQNTYIGVVVRLA